MAHKLGPSWFEEDLQEYLERGELKSSREILKLLLQDRFGRLSKKLVQQIDAATDLDQLRQAIRRVSNCESLKEFQL